MQLFVTNGYDRLPLYLQTHHTILVPWLLIALKLTNVMSRLGFEELHRQRFCQAFERILCCRSNRGDEVLN